MPIRPEMRARYPKDWKLRSYFVRFVRDRLSQNPRHRLKFHRR